MTLELAAVEDSAEDRKARGAFFTPTRVAEFVTEWAVRDQADSVFEPSCGEAAFLVAAARRLSALGNKKAAVGQLAGVELHEDSAERARKMVAQAGHVADIRTGDFFDVDPDKLYDAVIGNPPYVRYQDFTGAARVKSRAAALGAGVQLTALASSWAAFTIHATQYLRPGGRMGLVLPAELLSVNYAAGVRRYLMESFAEVSLVMFEERVFAGVLEEVVLLLADGYRVGRTDHASIHQVRSPADLSKSLPSHRWVPPRPEDKWTASLLGGSALAEYVQIANTDGFGLLESWGDTTLGMVTGNNKYFALSPERVRSLGLKRSEIVRLSPPGSKHLRGLDLTSESLAKLGAAGSATWLFRPGNKPSDAAKAYIEAGRIAGVDTAYKCRVRSPWWRVPLIPPADLLLTYMNSDTPRITTNSAAAHHLNSVHGVYLREDLKALGAEVLPLAALNSVTLLGAEIVGRAYGGGMLKLEPREADLLPMPAASLVALARDSLMSVRLDVSRALERGELITASRIVDDILVAYGMETSSSTLVELRDARAMLLSRRLARATKPLES